MGGYFFFSTYWVPRIILTLKARNWVTQFQALPVGFLLSDNTWPEIFLMFVQFTGLALVVSQLSIIAVGFTLNKPNRSVLPTLLLLNSVDNKFFLWICQRDYVLYRPRWTLLTTTLGGVLSKCSFYTPGGRTFPALVLRLRKKLLREVLRLSGLGQNIHFG